jgi:hypothetical protein
MVYVPILPLSFTGHDLQIPNSFFCSFSTHTILWRFWVFTISLNNHSLFSSSITAIFYSSLLQVPWLLSSSLPGVFSCNSFWSPYKLAMQVHSITRFKILPFKLYSNLVWNLQHIFAKGTCLLKVHNTNSNSNETSTWVLLGKTSCPNCSIVVQKIIFVEIST